MSPILISMHATHYNKMSNHGLCSEQGSMVYDTTMKLNPKLVLICSFDIVIELIQKSIHLSLKFNLNSLRKLQKEAYRKIRGRKKINIWKMVRLVPGKICRKDGTKKFSASSVSQWKQFLYIWLVELFTGTVTGVFTLNNFRIMWICIMPG